MRNYNRLLVLLSLLACLISPVYAGGLRNVAVSVFESRFRFDGSAKK